NPGQPLGIDLHVLLPPRWNLTGPRSAARRSRRLCIGPASVSCVLLTVHSGREHIGSVGGTQGGLILRKQSWVAPLWTVNNLQATMPPDDAAVCAGAWGSPLDGVLSSRGLPGGCGCGLCGREWGQRR